MKSRSGKSMMKKSMEHYQTMMKLYTFLAAACGVGVVIFGYLANNYKEKIDDLKKNEKPSIIKNNSHDTYNVNNGINNGIIGNGGKLIINESLDEQKAKKIQEAVKDLESDDVRVFESALNFLQANHDFSEKQIQQIYHILKLGKFQNMYQESIIPLLTYKESKTATEYFGENMRMYFHVPSLSIEYFSKNRIDFHVFSNYLKKPIIEQIDKSTIPTVILENCKFNKDYILKFLNSKELMNLMFDKIHPNYIKNLEMNFDIQILNHLSKKEFESTYYYDVISKLRSEQQLKP